MSSQRIEAQTRIPDRFPDENGVVRSEIAYLKSLFSCFRTTDGKPVSDDNLTGVTLRLNSGNCHTDVFVLLNQATDKPEDVRAWSMDGGRSWSVWSDGSRRYLVINLPGDVNPDHVAFSADAAMPAVSTYRYPDQISASLLLPVIANWDADDDISPGVNGTSPCPSMLRGISVFMEMTAPYSRYGNAPFAGYALIEQGEGLGAMTA